MSIFYHRVNTLLLCLLHTLNIFGYFVTHNLLPVYQFPANNSSPSNIFSTSDIMLITYRMHHHMKKMTYKSNIIASNNTSVITFIGPIYPKKTLWLYFQKNLWKALLNLTNFVWSHQKFFTFRLHFYDTDILPWRLIPWRSPPVLSSALNTFECLLLLGFSIDRLCHFTPSATVLSRRFTSFPHFGIFIV